MTTHVVPAAFALGIDRDARDALKLVASLTRRLDVALQASDPREAMPGERLDSLTWERCRDIGTGVAADLADLLAVLAPLARREEAALRDAAPEPLRTLTALDIADTE